MAPNQYEDMMMQKLAIYPGAAAGSMSQSLGQSGWYSSQLNCVPTDSAKPAKKPQKEPKEEPAYAPSRLLLLLEEVR